MVGKWSLATGQDQRDGWVRKVWEVTVAGLVLGWAALILGLGAAGKLASEGKDTVSCRGGNDSGGQQTVESVLTAPRDGVTTNRVYQRSGDEVGPTSIPGVVRE